MLRRLAIPFALSALALAAGCDSSARPADPADPTATAATCTRCHGDPAAGNAAPPRSVAGLADTAQLAVGAHQAHLAGGTLRGPISCGECHVVPSSVGAPGHMGKEHAAVTFGPLATSGGAAASWDRGSATCATYCHGATLPGGTNLLPRWTQVDGTQAACGSCHGVPPPAQHVQSSDCGSCHPGYTASSVNLATHVDGHVEIGNLACMSCHGDASRNDPAPPKGTHGETATTARAVGAHQTHLAGGARGVRLACSEGHLVPPDLSHVDGP